MIPCICWFCVPAIIICILLYVLNSKYRSKRLENLQSRPVFVTGCDMGFGFALALKLLEEGMPVFAGCLTKDGAQKLKTSSENLKGNLETIQLDVTDEKSIDSAFQFVASKTNAVWALVNNAGIFGPICPDDWLKISDFQRTLDVNTLGMIRVCHRFKSMVKKRQGRIVNITSAIGKLVTPLMAPYSVSKFAAEAYCDVLRLEMAQFGVTVHILEPGGFGTNLLSAERNLAVMKQHWDDLEPETKEEYGAKYLEQCQASWLKGLEEATKDISPVVDAYFHAITAAHPCKRYWVGSDAKFLYRPLSLSPTSIQDWFWGVFGKIFKLPTPEACQHL